MLKERYIEYCSAFVIYKKKFRSSKLHNNILASFTAEIVPKSNKNYKSTEHCLVKDISNSFVTFCVNIKRFVLI